MPHTRRTHYDIESIPEPGGPLRNLRVGSAFLGATALLAAVTGMRPEQAEEVLYKAGGVQGLARMSEAVLQTLPHVGAKRAKQIYALTEWAVLLTRDDGEYRKEIRSPEDVAALLMVDMGRLEQEELRIVGLDTKYHVKWIETLYLGTAYGTDVRVVDIFAKPVSLKCAAITLAQNHPSGDPNPSREDIHLTELVRVCGEQLGIELRDHVIFGRNRYVSLRQRGLGFDV